jgi:hypothetical protein
MSHTSADSLNIHITFVLRFSRDRLTRALRIMLQPADSSDRRVFADLESAFAYLESVVEAKMPANAKEPARD